MEEILGKLSREKLLAMGSILGLHDSKDPSNITWAHINASSGENEKKPFSEIAIPSMRQEILYETSTAGGHTIANLFRGGKGVSYRKVVHDVAVYLKIEPSPVSTIAEVEGMIAQKVLKTILDKLTPEQRDELAANLEILAEKHGKNFKSQGGVLVALSAAQLSGFSIYLAASAVLGAITGILGITLPFFIYAGVSKILAVLIGPLGWTALGVGAFYKLGSPNMKKLLPVVLFIAAERSFAT